MTHENSNKNRALFLRRKISRDDKICHTLYDRSVAINAVPQSFLSQYDLLTSELTKEKVNGTFLSLNRVEKSLSQLWSINND